MNSIEKRRTVAKIVLVLSTALLILLLLTQFYPEIFFFTRSTDTPPSITNLKDAHKDLIDRYTEYNNRISAANESAENLNASINTLNGYADKKIPRYAIGAGISIILGLWISTVILYVKVSRDLFKE